MYASDTDISPVLSWAGLSLDCFIIRKVMSTSWAHSVHAQECPQYFSVVEARRHPEHYREQLVGDTLRAPGHLPCFYLPYPSIAVCDAYWQLHIQLLLMETSSSAGQTVLQGTDLPSWKWGRLVFRPAKELPGLGISDPGSCGQGQRSLPTPGAWLPTSSTRPWTASRK